MLFNNSFILASSSKSRFLILKNNKLNFYCIAPTIDEEFIKKQKFDDNISPKNLSLYLAKKKALSISKNKQNHLVVGSDTVIEFNKKIVKKAKNTHEAKKKLVKLSGKKIAYIQVL